MIATAAAVFGSICGVLQVTFISTMSDKENSDGSTTSPMFVVGLHGSKVSVDPSSAVRGSGLTNGTVFVQMALDPESGSYWYGLRVGELLPKKSQTLALGVVQGDLPCPRDMHRYDLASEVLPAVGCGVLVGYDLPKVTVMSKGQPRERKLDPRTWRPLKQLVPGQGVVVVVTRDVKGAGGAGGRWSVGVAVDGQWRVMEPLCLDESKVKKYPPKTPHPPLVGLPSRCGGRGEPCQVRGYHAG